MSPSESLRHQFACVGAGACLLLVLFCGASQASTGRVADEQPMEASAAVSVSEGALPPMPGAVDDMPCAQCYVAPGPGTNGIGAESGPRETPARQQHATSVADTTFFHRYRRLATATARAHRILPVARLINGEGRSYSRSTV